MSFANNNNKNEDDCCQSGAERESKEIFLQEDGIVLLLLSFLNVSDVTRFQRVDKHWQGLCSSSINNSNNFLPKKEFLHNGELCYTIRRYCSGKYGIGREEQLRYNQKDVDEIARMYGYPINTWKVGKVEYFCNVFLQQTRFNEYIGDWDVSKGTSMYFMFYNASSFNQDLSKWDTGQVTCMNHTFKGASSFNHSIVNWDVSGVVESIHYFGILKQATSYQHPLPPGWDHDTAFGVESSSEEEEDDLWRELRNSKRKRCNY